MKKLAIPIENGKLLEHFGHAREFAFYEIEDDKIVNSYSKEPPPHEEGVIPRWLASEQATDILVGGIGPKAIQILYNYGINVYVAVAIDEVNNLVSDFINGNLKFGQNYCHH